MSTCLVIKLASIISLQVLTHIHEMCVETREHTLLQLVQCMNINVQYFTNMNLSCSLSTAKIV